MGQILTWIWTLITVVLKIIYSNQPAILLWNRKKQSSGGWTGEKGLLIHLFI